MTPELMKLEQEQAAIKRRAWYVAQIKREAKSRGFEVEDVGDSIIARTEENNTYSFRPTVLEYNGNSDANILEYIKRNMARLAGEVYPPKPAKAAPPPAKKQKQLAGKAKAVAAQMAEIPPEGEFNELGEDE